MSTGRLDLSDAVECVAEDVRWRRWGASSTTAEGLRAPGASTISTARGSVHPAPGEVLDRLPPGQRSNRTVVGYFSGVELRTVDDIGGTRADEIEFEGEWFEVEQANRWRWGNYLEVIAQRVRR